ncbi:MAG: hypothetical protein ACAF41_13945 [Leptolyngbya sp. BL-A-14]
MNSILREGDIFTAAAAYCAGILKPTTALSLFMVASKASYG